MKKHPVLVLLAMTAMLPVFLSQAACSKTAGALPRQRSRISITRDQVGAMRLNGLGKILGFARNRDNTLVHCLELVLEATGRRISYDELMGLSGLAFRLQFRVDRWDPGNPDPLVGVNCLDILAPLIGIDYELFVYGPNATMSKNEVNALILESLNQQNMPVLASNIMPPENWGIITGYRSDGTWLCRAYNDGARDTDRAARGSPAAVVIITERRGRPDVVGAQKRSFKNAVELFERRKAGNHAVGKLAFGQWCEALLAASSNDYLHPNAWTYVSLIDARGAAARYLRSVADNHGSGRKHLLEAARLFDEEVKVLQDGYQSVPATSGTETSRRIQIEVLKKARELEVEAFKSLRKAA